MNIKRDALRGAIWSGIQNWGSQAGSLAIFLVLARLLDPADFGLVALANTFLVLVNIFIEQGFAIALIQRSDIDDRHLSTVFWTQMGLGIGFAAAGYVGADWVAGIFREPALTPILKWFAFLFVVKSLSAVPLAILSRRFAFKQIATRALFGIAISGVVGIAMAVLGFGVWSLVGQQFAYEGMGVIIFWGASGWRPALKFSRRHLRDLFSFGVSIFFANILKFFNQYSDNLLIGYFLGDMALGYYAIAYRILQVLIQLLVKTGNQVALPTLSRLQGEPVRFIRAFYKIVKLAGAIALPAFLGVIVLANELVVTFFGQKWEPSIAIMQVFTWGGIASLCLFFNRSAFVALGKPHWRLWLEFANALLNVTACLIAVRWGLLAVAAAYVLSDFAIVPASAIALKRLTGIELLSYFRQLAAPFICAVGMMVVVGSIKYMLAGMLAPPAILAICTMAGILSYVACLRLLTPDFFDELWKLADGNLVKLRRQT